MTNSKATKKALFTSMISLLLCFTMLMGATFAWFTDTVKSTGNRIVAGNLDVDLVMYKEAEGKYVSIADGEGDIFSEATGNGTNWEPGKTEIVYLGVQNKGSLALKYNIILDIIDGEIPLSGSLEYALIDGEKYEANKFADWNAVKAAAGEQVAQMLTGTGLVAAKNGVLDEIMRSGEKDETNYFVLAVHMKEEAGNEYQNGSITIDLTVLATQVEAELDSFGPTYDANADFDGQISTYEALVAKLAEGGTYQVVNNITVPENASITIPEGTSLTLNLGSYAITGNNAKGTATIQNNGTLAIVGGTVSSTATNGAAAISNSGTLTLKGVTVNGAPIDGETEYPEYTVSTSGTLVVEEGTKITADRGGIAMSDGANVTINGGNITVSDAADGRNMTLHTIYAYGYDSKLTINDGYFEMRHTSIAGASVICPAGASITINGGDFRDAMDDDNWTSTGNFQNYMGYGVALNVRGGTYDDNTVTKNLAEGYSVVENSDGTYTVVKGVLVENADALTDAITDGADSVYLTAGTYKLPSAAAGKTLTISGDKDTKIDVTSGLTYVNGADLTFEGLTIKSEPEGEGYTNGFADAKNAVFNNCVIDGTIGLDFSTEFNNCVFNIEGNYYNVWTWGAGTATFNGCTFNCDGKALLVYANVLDNGTNHETVNITDCVFNDKGDDTVTGKAAIEITNTYTPVRTYDVFIKNTKVNGFSKTVPGANDFNATYGSVEGSNIGTNVWGNKMQLPNTQLNVVIDGVDVY